MLSRDFASGGPYRRPPARPNQKVIGLIGGPFPSLKPIFSHFFSNFNQAKIREKFSGDGPYTGHLRTQIRVKSDFRGKFYFHPLLTTSQTKNPVNTTYFMFKKCLNRKLISESIKFLIPGRMASDLLSETFDDEYPDAPLEVLECPFLDKGVNLSFSASFFPLKISSFCTLELFCDSHDVVREFGLLRGRLPDNCSKFTVMSKIELSERWFDFS